jgi:hypothetical protein
VHPAHEPFHAYGRVGLVRSANSVDLVRKLRNATNEVVNGLAQRVEFSASHASNRDPFDMSTDVGKPALDVARVHDHHPSVATVTAGRSVGTVTSSLLPLTPVGRSPALGAPSEGCCGSPKSTDRGQRSVPRTEPHPALTDSSFIAASRCPHGIGE